MSAYVLEVHIAIIYTAMPKKKEQNMQKIDSFQFLK